MSESIVLELMKVVMSTNALVAAQKVTIDAMEGRLAELGEDVGELKESIKHMDGYKDAMEKMGELGKREGDHILNVEADSIDTIDQSTTQHLTKDGKKK